MELILYPEDLVGKSREDAVALIACWVMSIADAALGRGIDPHYVADALGEVRREIDNDILELQTSAAGERPTAKIKPHNPR